MVKFKTLDVRWIWRYRLFYLAGIAIMSLQIFLAVIFFTLYEETDKNSGDSFNSNVLLTDQEPELRSHEKVDIPKQYSIQNEINQNSKYFRNKDDAILINKPTQPERFGLSGVCNVSGREPISAINRAKTSYCKQLILNTTCSLHDNQLFPVTLPHSCPASGLTSGKYLGCFRDQNNFRLLNGAYYNSSKFNSWTHCMNKCLQAGFPYAGVQFADECFCGNDKPPTSALLPDSFCNIKCPSNLSQMCGGYFTMNVLETGVAKFSAQTANDVSSYSNNDSNPPVRVVFLLTLNGRAVRQVYRLIKMLFHRDHFFFIHVDARQDYMFRELLSLELKLSNVRLSRRRHSTIWGGASLLTMLLQSMSELIQSSWDWDFLINLSESDFPIKSNKELVAFLSANRNRNFVKSHGRDVQHFIHKQGLDKTFVECDEHMWRIGNKILPTGIVVDGGSDWIALSHPFINYVVTAQNDQLLEGLKIIFKHTLLPAESFFHTVLRNSIFCDTYVDNNLHVTNWKRRLGCKCQYKHVVDWCGCSPNVFTADDWSRIQSTVNKSLFFARKFDPTVSQIVINKVEDWLYGRYSDDFKSEQKYWQNVYHHLDHNFVTDDAVIAVCSSLSRHMLKFLTDNDLMCSDIQFNKLLQVYSFYENDMQKGILVNFDGVLVNNISVQFEVWYEIKNLFTLYNSSRLASRFINLMVNTNFDQKEKMSRNYVAAIGPLSEPVLIYQIIAGLAVSNISLVWLDPAQTVADIGEIELDEVPGVYYFKPNLKVPLSPGEWVVYLIHEDSIVAEIPFFVIPVVYKHTSMLSNGVEQALEPIKSSYLLRIIKLKRKYYKPKNLKEESAVKNSYTGSKLIEWIDTLTKKLYKMVDFCIVKKVNTDRTSVCYQQNFQHCDTSFWSSFSPDPKIHITTVNKSTGRLN